MSSLTEYANDWGRKQLVNWVIGDVARTQDAQALEMLRAFTKRVMPKDSMEKPADVFERILQQVRLVRPSATEAAQAAGPAKKKKKARTRAGRAKGRKPPTGGRAQTQPQGIHQTSTAGPSSGDATQAAEGPTTAQKGVIMLQAYDAFLAAPSENAMYPLFITMTNSALDLLKNEHVEGTILRNTEYDILLQHSDPSLLTYEINGKVHRGKPDNIFVTLETAQKLHGDENASWSDITANYATKSPTKHGKGADLDWGDALCSVEHKRTSGTITRSAYQELNERTVLPSLHDLDRLRPSPTKSSGKDPIDALSEVNETTSNETTSGSKPAKTSQGTRVTVTGPSHANAEDSQAYIQGPAPEPEVDLLSSVAVQSAEYGLGRLCCSYDISHTFTLIVVDGVLHISWYDHEGIITTNGLDLAKYFDYYLALLFILQRFGRSAWGRLEDENLRSDRNGTKDETRISVEGKKFTFNMKVDENVLRKPFAIGGRATSLYRCQMEGDQAPRHVIKCNWKEATQKSEQFILKDVRERLRKQASLPVDPETGEVFDESDDLRSYLPEVVAGVETEISTRTIRDDLKIRSHPRELVIIVFVMLDGTINQLQGEEYWQVFWDCLRCHKRLFKLGIYHCDISNGNLMFIRRNGHTFGILNDFDLAVIGDTPSKKQHHTGTRPFMATQLLGSEVPIKHHYKHDAESFFWVAVYNSTYDATYDATYGSTYDSTYDSPYDSPSNGFLHGWGQMTDSDLGAQKSSYLHWGTQKFPMKETYQPIVSWVDGLRELFLFMPMRKKDWGIDELYNTLRESRHDQGKTLAAHIKTRQGKYPTPAAS